MLVRIKNLRLRTVIGVLEWERQAKQDVTVNIELEFDGTRACRTDDLLDAVDYRAIKQRVIEEVERSQFFLLERLAARILELVMAEPRVQSATVEVDKPHALRFADSVSVACSARRGE